jgi:phosphoglycerol transferase MdoB-like AlkP superfamily enzyme
MQQFFKSLSLNIYQATAKRLLLTMGLFSLLRCFFYWYNLGFFPNLSLQRLAHIFWGGLRFDLVAVLYTNILFIFLMLLPFKFRYQPKYQRFTKVLFLVTNGIAFGFNCIDIAYFRFTLRRTSRSVLEEFSNETNLPILAMQFCLDYWFLLLLLASLLFVLFRFYGRQLSKPKEYASGKVYYPFGILMLCIGIVFFVGGVRGGYEKGLRPITLSNAGKYVERPLEMAIVLNTPFSIYKTLEITPLQAVKYFEKEEDAAALFTPIHFPKSNTKFKPQNVVVLILESFGTEYIGALNGLSKGYTPFMDSIIGESLTFKHSFANGKKSIDAMPSILASIPSLVEPYVLTPYAGNEINTLASVLGQKGYSTAFFHGAPNGSMGFQAFARIARYQQYIGKNEYNNDADFDGNWGIWDEEFLQFFAQEMNEMPEPFHTAIFTVSSHHPYKIPERYTGVFPDGDLRIHKCIGYTDYALRRFFNTASTMPWFENTLFVITADHTNLDTKHSQFQTSSGVFRVPIIFYSPNDALKGSSQQTVQQSDIMPSVLGKLEYDKPFIAFGNNVLTADSDENFVVNHNGFYQIFKADYLLQFNGKRTTGLFNFKNDTMLKTNLLDQLPIVKNEMELSLKSFIQQYNQRLIDNDLTIESEVKNID